MALLTALFATVLLMAMGLAVALLGSAETTLAAHDRDARSLAYASRAAAAVAAVDLRALASWDDLSSPGGVPEVSATPGPSSIQRSRRPLRGAGCRSTSAR
jgi:hypothetical protein